MTDEQRDATDGTSPPAVSRPRAESGHSPTSAEKSEGRITWVSKVTRRATDSLPRITFAVAHRNLAFSLRHFRRPSRYTSCVTRTYESSSRQLASPLGQRSRLRDAPPRSGSSPRRARQRPRRARPRPYGRATHADHHRGWTNADGVDAHAHAASAPTARAAAALAHHAEKHQDQFEHEDQHDGQLHQLAACHG